MSIPISKIIHNQQMKHFKYGKGTVIKEYNNGFLVKFDTGTEVTINLNNLISHNILSNCKFIDSKVQADVDIYINELEVKNAKLHQEKLNELMIKKPEVKKETSTKTTTTTKTTITRPKVQNNETTMLYIGNMFSSHINFLNTKFGYTYRDTRSHLYHSLNDEYSMITLDLTGDNIYNKVLSSSEIFSHVKYNKELAKQYKNKTDIKYLLFIKENKGKGIKYMGIFKIDYDKDIFDTIKFTLVDNSIDLSII